MSTDAHVEAPVGTVFESRWVSLPAGVQPADPNKLPQGFRAGGVAAGIKKSGKLDFGLIVSDLPGTESAAVFTRSSAPAPPVNISKKHADLGSLRAVVVNSGNANAATGWQGRDLAIYMQGVGAMAAGVTESQVALASTGVIGEPIEQGLISKGAAVVTKQLRQDGALEFAQAIMTTDSGPKLAAVEVALSGGTVKIGVQAKGAGMMAPNHATLLCFIETDAKIDAATCDQLLRSAVGESFDRITVDGQLSTNDSVFLLANGASSVAFADDQDQELFSGALTELLKAIAIVIVADGEGALRIGRVTVTGADNAVCERVARAVADSPLVKTALNGGDANWGRVAQAVGMALGTGEAVPFDISIEGIQVCKAGDAARFETEQLDELVKGNEVEYEIALPGDGAATHVYFSDLSHEYVSINADYRS